MPDVVSTPADTLLNAEASLPGCQPGSLVALALETGVAGDRMGLSLTANAISGESSLSGTGVLSIQEVNGSDGFLATAMSDIGSRQDVILSIPDALLTAWQVIAGSAPDAPAVVTVADGTCEATVLFVDLAA